LSGYGGQPPGWRDPYGRPGWDPQGDYAQHAGQDPYAQRGHGYGPLGAPQSHMSTGHMSTGPAIAALVCNVLLVLFCCNPLAIPGIVTSAMATSRTSTNPESARRLMVWSWVICGVSFVLGIAAFVILALLGGLSDHTATSTPANSF
jgi:Na+/proline symporter